MNPQGRQQAQILLDHMCSGCGVRGHKVCKHPVSPEAAVLGMKGGPDARSGQKGQDRSPLTGSQFNRHIKPLPSQLRKESGLIEKLGLDIPRGGIHPKDAIDARMRFNELGRLFPDCHHNPGIGKMFPEGTSTGKGQHHISDVPELNQQDLPEIRCMKNVHRKCSMPVRLPFIRPRRQSRDTLSGARPEAGYKCLVSYPFFCSSQR